MNQLKQDRDILNDFLDIWTLEKIRSLKLEEYVNIGDKNTFCHWVEIRTKRLGSINGVPSTKFGIFKHTKKDPSKAFSRLLYDHEYAWDSKYGNTREVAFQTIKGHILKVIEHSIRDEYEEIDQIPINSIFKWKVAFLYSNEGFIPIFNTKALKSICADKGILTNRRTQPSEMHRCIRDSFDGVSVFDYMRELYGEFRGEETKQTSNKGRKSTTSKNEKEQFRKGTLGGVVCQYHNELQNTLYEKLIIEHGVDSVSMEKDYVDITVELDDKKIFYEVKSDGRPAQCIKQAIGQLLFYAYKAQSHKTIEFVVYGKNAPNKFDKSFIQYLKLVLTSITFRYEHLK